MEKRRRGRPLKSVGDFPHGWKQEVLELASAGATDVDVRSYLGISPGTWYRLLAGDMEFQATIEKADALRVSFWLRQRAANRRRPGFNSVRVAASA